MSTGFWMVLALGVIIGIVLGRFVWKGPRR